jgi:metal-responsive CopG/Arc/MetJ family transcriptional regulator
MKTAISLSDKLFQQADEAAKALGVSRSELYANALSDYLTRRSAEQITAKLNQVYQSVEGRPEPGLSASQARASRQDHW